MDIWPDPTYEDDIDDEDLDDSGPRSPTTLAARLFGPCPPLIHLSSDAHKTAGD